ncbi:hypothetical protein OFM36_27135, partial [Escherichia coli]|nr:hypothetical protein [Escherichia coli]
NPDNIFDSAAIKRIAINSPTPLVAGNLTNQALMDAYNVEEKQVTVSLSDTLKRLPSTNGSNLISARKFNQTM